MPQTYPMGCLVWYTPFEPLALVISLGIARTLTIPNNCPAGPSSKTCWLYHAICFREVDSGLSGICPSYCIQSAWFVTCSTYTHMYVHTCRPAASAAPIRYPRRSRLPRYMYGPECRAVLSERELSEQIWRCVSCYILVSSDPGLWHIVGPS